MMFGCLPKINLMFRVKQNGETELKLNRIEVCFMLLLKHMMRWRHGREMSLQFDPKHEMIPL